jgi:hypothetical protein
LPIKAKELDPRLCKTGDEYFDMKMLELWEYYRSVAGEGFNELDASYFEALADGFLTCKTIKFYDDNPDVAYADTMADAARGL